jgi:predicted nucleic acid-binding Zn ribbon protein
VVPESGGCLKCTGAIPAGRRGDSRYCSESCKLAARLERKRLQTRLQHLETWQSNARMLLLPKRQLTQVQDEIDQAEARLKALLGG